MRLRFGFGIFTGQASPGGSAESEIRTFLDLMPTVEESGFDSVWVSEHHFASDSYLPSPLPLLAAVAARTQRVELGTALLVAGLHHPLRVAEDAAIVDLISGGRLTLGLGVGWRDEEFRALGADKSQRGDSLEHLCGSLRLAWTGERFSYGAGPTPIEQVQVRPTPTRQIPLWIGGIARTALLRAGRIGDGFLASQTDSSTLTERVLIVDEGARLAGRPHPVPVGIILDAWVGPANTRVRDAYWAAYGAYPQWRAGVDAPGRPYRLPSTPADAGPPFAGEPNEVATKIADYIGGVVDDRDVIVIVRLEYPGLDGREVSDAVRSFGAEVAPLVRELSDKRRSDLRRPS